MSVRDLSYRPQTFERLSCNYVLIACDFDCQRGQKHDFLLETSRAWLGCIWTESLLCFNADMIYCCDIKHHMIIHFVEAFVTECSCTHKYLAHICIFVYHNGEQNKSP